MVHKEKGRPAGGDPIPNTVCQDSTEFTSRPLNLQVARLIRRCALSAATAALVPLVYPEAS
jgi:hypothetical protein